MLEFKNLESEIADIRNKFKKEKDECSRQIEKMTETICKLWELRNKKQTEIETLTKQKEEFVKTLRS